jgi:hypothetical protein
MANYGGQERIFQKRGFSDIQCSGEQYRYQNNIDQRRMVRRDNAASEIFYLTWKFNAYNSERFKEPDQHHPKITNYRLTKSWRAQNDHQRRNKKSAKSEKRKKDKRDRRAVNHHRSSHAASFIVIHRPSRDDLTPEIKSQRSVNVTDFLEGSPPVTTSFRPEGSSSKKSEAP